MTFSVNYAPFDVDKFLRDALHADQSAAWDPACNTYEDEEGYWVQVALPGMERKDINIVFEDGVLTVKGELKEATPNRTYFTREIERGNFARAFRLPGTVDPGKVSASYKEGLLTIQIPKREETKARQIAVE